MNKDLELAFFQTSNTLGYPWSFVCRYLEERKKSGYGYIATYLKNVKFSWQDWKKIQLSKLIEKKSDSVMTS